MTTAFQPSGFQNSGYQIEIVAGFICDLNVTWRATSITMSISYNTVETEYVCRP